MEQRQNYAAYVTPYIKPDGNWYINSGEQKLPYLILAGLDPLGNVDVGSENVIYQAPGVVDYCIDGYFQGSPFVDRFQTLSLCHADISLTRTGETRLKAGAAYDKVLILKIITQK